MGLLTTLQAAAAPPARIAASDEPVFDLAFEVQGSELSADYHAALAAAVLASLPWAADDPLFGIHRINAPLTDAGYLLSRRSRLQLRVGKSRLADAAALAGQTLELGAARLALGGATPRPLTPFPTLGAPLVVNTQADEPAFLEDLGLQLELLGVDAGVICGKPAELAGPTRKLNGFAVVLHQLSPADSVRIQKLGLGSARRLGCGLFTHHKIIDVAEAWSD